MYIDFQNVIIQWIYTKKMNLIGTYSDNEKNRKYLKNKIFLIYLNIFLNIIF